jgi:CsoR family transcriptional regulator, copper-sensing transcriptional repressor
MPCLQRKVKEDTYSIEVLAQSRRPPRPPQSVGLNLLDEHLNCCVNEAITKAARRRR